jgi:hypothetical protein
MSSPTNLRLKDGGIWTEDGKRMTEVARTRQPRERNERQKIINWCEGHCEGQYVVTPTYIFFENSSDALLFNLGFVTDAKNIRF